jgi:hypothetical protein
VATKDAPRPFWVIWTHPDKPGPQTEGFAKHAEAIAKFREVEHAASWAIFYEEKPDSAEKRQNEILRAKGIY